MTTHLYLRGEYRGDVPYTPYTISVSPVLRWRGHGKPLGVTVEQKRRLSLSRFIAVCDTRHASHAGLERRATPLIYLVCEPYLSRSGRCPTHCFLPYTQHLTSKRYDSTPVADCTRLEEEEEERDRSPKPYDLLEFLLIQQTLISFLMITIDSFSSWLTLWSCEAMLTWHRAMSLIWIAYPYNLHFDFNWFYQLFLCWHCQIL